MSGKTKIFLDDQFFYKFETSYTNVNGIWLYPMEYMKIHSGTELGLQELSIQGTEKTEVVFANLDLLASIGAYTVDPTSNSIIFIVDKTIVDTEQEAIDYIRGFLLTYEMKSLEYFSTDALYTMDSYCSDGTFIGSTLASSTSVLVSKMMTLDASQNVNSSVGYQYHILKRALQVE